MKYIQLTKTWMQRHLAYRGRVVIWAVVDIASFFIFPFIWLAAYGDRQMIAGFSRADIVTYYIVLAFINIGFTSHIYSYFRQDIIQGELNKYLIRPLHYIAYQFIHEFSYRMIALLLAIFFLAAFIFGFRGWVVFPHSIIQACLFTVAIFCSLAISFLMQVIVGTATFWMGDNGALHQLRFLAEKVFSGELAPLVFFPAMFQTVAAFMPFQYLMYFPTQIYLGRINGWETAVNFAIVLFWILALSGAAWLMWKKGLRRYEGAGI